MPGPLCTLLNLYWYVLIARIIFSWIPTAPGSVPRQINDAVHLLTEPLLGPLRNLIGPVRLGGLALDLSATIVIFAWPILLGLIGC